MDFNLVDMGYAPKVADIDHKELDISPTERYFYHTKVDSAPFPPPQRWVLTKVRLILTVI